MADVQAATPDNETPEIKALNELIYESTLLAEQNPYFARARSLATYRPILPLEPGGTKPMVGVDESSQDLRTLMGWWASWPDANVGTIVGRISNIIALRVTNPEALRKWATVTWTDPDRDRKYEEIQEIGGGVVTIGTVQPQTRKRGVAVWGAKAFNARANELLEADRPKVAVRWIVYEYAPRDPQTGLAPDDNLEFPARHIADGVDVLGPGVALPLAGALLDGTEIRNAGLIPGQIPIPRWLSERIAKPRKGRK
jgi:hypothetical protein